MKNILITGCSRGIGFETAKACARKGHSVFALSRNEESLKVLRSLGSSISVHVCDITDEHSIENVLDDIQPEAGWDVLINNAGMLINKPFTELSDTDWEAMFQVNVMGAVRLINRMIPFFNAGAHIVNIASMGGLQGSSKFAGLSGYSATKGALAILSECLATEFLSKSISVNCLCLGAVQTEMLEAAFPGYKAPVSSGEMAEFISHFALHAAHFFNGKVIPVALQDPS